MYLSGKEVISKHEVNECKLICGNFCYFVFSHTVVYTAKSVKNFIELAEVQRIVFYRLHTRGLLVSRPSEYMYAYINITYLCVRAKLKVKFEKRRTILGVFLFNKSFDLLVDVWEQRSKSILFL